MTTKAFYPVPTSSIVPKRILLVDDSRSQATLRVRQLRNFGFRVDWADCVNLAYSYSQDRRYDVIVVALGSEASRSTELMQRLRKLSPRPALAFLANKDSVMPAVWCENVLWSEEHPEYMAARIEAIAAA